jgi:hypothetical protein
MGREASRPTCPARIGEEFLPLFAVVAVVVKNS